MDAEVLIVGAGPTGLLLAGDLARAGVDVAILERRTSEANLTRAFVVHARTLELLDARDVADELIKSGKAIGVMQLFGNLDLDLSRLPTAFPYLLSTPQYNTERVLRERAERLGVRIVGGTEVVGVIQGDSGVNVDVRTGGGTHTWQARYLVGTDGVHSAVRAALGMPYEGHSAVQSVMLADVRLRGVPERELVVRTAREGFAFISSFGDGWYRIIAWDRRRQVPEDTPLTLGEVSEITRLAFGHDYGMHDPRWLSRFHSDERQVCDYRVGRVFLAGDAAHCHSPAGGQGMNTGLGDAANLGWKLAAVVQGWAPESLLDTYDLERHPVGEQVIENSSMLLTLALGRKLWHRMARQIVPVVAGNVRPITKRLSEIMSGIGIAYPAPHGAHARVGRRADDVRLAPGGPSRLGEVLRPGRLVYVSEGKLPDHWSDHVDAVAPATASASILVRPDGHVAWASDEVMPSAPPKLEDIMRHD